MAFLAHLSGGLPMVALVAEPALGSEGDSGMRTVVAALVTLGVIAVAVLIGLAMGRGERA
jgi:hypothetical protein